MNSLDDERLSILTMNSSLLFDYLYACDMLPPPKIQLATHMLSFLLDLTNHICFRMSSSPNIDAVGILKRRCEVLEEQLAVISTPKPKK
jgi:hypothetical protein